MRRVQSGVSLVELLVSITILALATTVALVVYDQARLAYKHAENVTEQQQVARVAFDIITSDIRMAGFNTNPDGNKTRPDEQLEAAYATAITVRADFDADDPIEFDLPEQTLAGTGAAFAAVSTGNDEIVSYVLAKPDGNSTDTLAFGADVGATVRDASIEDVTVGNVDLTQSDPPYTLYQVVLENDPSGCCGTSFARRIPIVDNVRSLRFRYFDRSGTELAAPGGEETPEAIAARASIRRVGVEIEALTRDADPHWVDADDSNPATRKFRKFELEGEVTPPNLGRGAIRDLQADLVPPSPPNSPWLYPGHCGGLFINWQPNPAQDDVAYYRLAYGVDSGAMDGLRSALLPGLFVDGLGDDTAYYVSLQAIDASGNVSIPGPLELVTTSNTNTPLGVLALNSIGGTEQIDLDWSETAENTASTSGDPASPEIRDLAGYRIYRSKSSGFTPSGSNRIADENDVADLPAPVFTDLEASRCTPQYYRVTAVDECGLEGQPSNQVSAQSWTDVDPREPIGVQAFSEYTSNARVEWSEVHEDVDGRRNYVDRYEIYRSPLQAAGLPEPASWSYVDVVSNATVYHDSIVIPAGQTVYYRVKAVDTCSPPNESELSASAPAGCRFRGQIVIQEPDFDDNVKGTELVQVENINSVPTAVNTEVRLTWVAEDGDSWTTTIGSGGAAWSYSWDATPTGIPLGFFQPGRYVMTAEVDQTYLGQSCTAIASVRIVVDD
jgi:prepilin-type N-terminal cleavage/methylation domain-containing protein